MTVELQETKPMFDSGVAAATRRICACVAATPRNIRVPGRGAAALHPTDGPRPRRCCALHPTVRGRGVVASSRSPEPTDEVPARSRDSGAIGAGAVHARREVVSKMGTSTVAAWSTRPSTEASTGGGGSAQRDRANAPQRDGTLRPAAAGARPWPDRAR